MKLELLRVPAGANEVAYLRYIPRKPRGTTIVAAHGYSSSKQNLDLLCAFLAGHGVEIFSLDFPGHRLGASAGRLDDFSDCLDAMAAVTRVARETASNPFLLGHSLGAVTALVTASRDAEIAGVVAIATGYGRPAALEALRKTIATDLRAEYVVGAALPELFAGMDARIDEAMPRLAGRPLLFVLAERDAMVTPTSAAALFERAPEPKELARIDSNHTLAAENARTPILAWLKRVAPL